MRAHHNNTVLRQTFILILAGAFTANAQTLVGSLGAMGIAGTLQSINSTAAINGLNAANGLTGINAQQNAAVNQAVNGASPQGPASPSPVGPAVMPTAGGMGGMGGGVTPPPSGNHHPTVAGNIRVRTVPFHADSFTSRHRGGILRMVGGYGGFRVSPRLGRSAPASRGVMGPVASTASARAQRSSVSISSLRVNPSRTYRRNIRMGFRLQ